MITFILALIIVFIAHELGHIIFIMMFNVTEKKPFYYIAFEINMKYFLVIHEKFNSHLKNIIVAMSGSLFPVFISIMFIIIKKNQFTNIFLFLSLVNLVMLHHHLPDGKSIVNILKEMSENNDNNI